MEAIRLLRNDGAKYEKKCEGRLFYYIYEWTTF